MKAAIADAKAGLLKFQAKAVDKAKQVTFKISVEQVQAAKTAGISEDRKLEVLKNISTINGMGNGSFAPSQTASRAQAAVIFYQLLQKSTK
ncbi:hypothetical protein BK120_20010 [Paenibacillus sp. FSL A5-0031]|uniref:S-layer homology domain-containing protein n=1 Tax=Paenibacillus sp. FSL A5-0031 TaxID=1920420 RepID=UPI00096DEFB4|nr:S-layer homology domain-containing protein [Paenibacillus sp. FSL A5-0031]OME80123.1 hypothetical protein BK120_20010 [Paenibacillus sp. FSL A5-0031]